MDALALIQEEIDVCLAKRGALCARRNFEDDPSRLFRVIAATFGHFTFHLSDARRPSALINDLILMFYQSNFLTSRCCPTSKSA